MREYEVLGHDPQALAKAKAAFAYVEGGDAFALGACPEVRYQQASGEVNHLKTLETDANAIKAAILLYQATGDRTYLDSAVTHYAAVRARFLDPVVPLYSVYVFDDGQTCTQVPHRFFASVNGDMIWSGLELSRLTGTQSYLDEALATARAVAADLSDPAGVFADLQAENDIVEPLVEAMYGLATEAHEGLRPPVDPDERRGSPVGARARRGIRPLLRRPAAAHDGDRVADERRPRARDRRRCSRPERHRSRLGGGGRSHAGWPPVGRPCREGDVHRLGDRALRHTRRGLL